MDRRKVALLVGMAGVVGAVLYFKSKEAGAIPPRETQPTPVYSRPTKGTKPAPKPSHGKPAPKEYPVSPSLITVSTDKTTYNLGDRVKVTVSIVTDRSVPYGEYGVVFVDLYAKKPDGSVVKAGSDEVRVVGGNNASVDFILKPDEAGKWWVWAVARSKDGNKVVKSVMTWFNVVQKGPMGYAYIRELKLYLNNTKATVGDTVSGYFTVTLDRTVNRGYACVPAVLIFNNSPAHVFWIFIHGGRSARQNISFKLGTVGKVGVWIQVRNPVPIMAGKVKVDWKWEDEKYVVSNSYVIEVKPRPVPSGALTAYITPERNTVKFTLSGGTYQLVAEREGDTAPRVIKVTEDYPPNDPRAKVLLNDIIVILSAPYYKTIYVDEGTHDVYVHISCGSGRWKVIIYRLQ